MPIANTPGGEIYYEEHGSPDGKPLLLIMGLAGRGSDWSPEFLSALGDEYRAITYDHRGVGLSAPAEASVTIPGMALDATQLLDALGIETARVAGISMGGMISQRLLIDHAGRIERAALIATHCGGRNAVMPLPHARAALINPEPGAAALRRAFETFVAPGLHERRPGALDSFIARKMEKPTRYRVMQAQLHAISSDDRFGLLGLIKSPTVVITGDVDPLVPPENSEILHAGITGSTLVVLPECGHAPMLECPDRLADELRDFLQ